MNRWITLASIVAIAASLRSADVLAQDTGQCPGDRVVWVSEQRIYATDRRASEVPGHFDCERRALKTGALPSTTYAKHAHREEPGDAYDPMSAAPPPPAPAPANEAAATLHGMFGDSMGHSMSHGGNRSHADSHSTVLDSVYDDVDRTTHREHAGYGRYTYVLLTGPADSTRNLTLLRAVMETTPIASSVTVDRRLLNVFEIPETARFWSDTSARTNPQKTLDTYDFGAAHELVLKACSAPERPALCTGDLAGPFLLTYAHPLEALSIANPPYLIVDLHRLNARGFGHMVGLMKEQVKESDVADGHLVESTSVHLLSTVLDISDWLPTLVSDTKNITSVVGKP